MTACRFYSLRAAGRCQDSRIQLRLLFNNTCHRHELPPPAVTGAASSVSNDPDRLTALTASTHGGDTFRVSAAEVATPVPAEVNAMTAHFAAGSCPAETQTVHQNGSRKTAQAQILTTWTGGKPAAAVCLSSWTVFCLSFYGSRWRGSAQTPCHAGV